MEEKSEAKNIPKEERQVLNERITIIIPTLNEEEAISMVLEELHLLGLNNILVIDGYSADRTIEVAKQFRVTTLYQKGKGKTGALKTAIAHVTTPYLLLLDGDFTYDPSCIDNFLEKADCCAEIIGVRIPTDNRAMTFIHKFGNKLITTIFNMFMGTNLSDLCSGMYLLRTDVARRIRLSSNGFDVEAEIAAQMASYGTIKEVPINYRPRLGKQKLSWKHGFTIIKSIIKFTKLYNPSGYHSFIARSMMRISAILSGVYLIEIAYSGNAFLLF